MGLSSANFVSYTDKLAAAMLTCVPQLGVATGSTTPGFGDSGIVKGNASDYGMLRKLRDLEDLLLTGSPADSNTVNAMLSSIRNAPNVVPLQKQLPATLGGILSALSNACNAAGLTGVTNINTFASYYNTGAGAPWNALVCPDFNTLFYYCNNNTNLTNTNVYFEVLQGATYTNGLAKLVVSGAVFTDGVAINNTKYAGGFGQVTVSGFAGTSDTVTVTGSWRKTDGTTATGNGTATVAGNGTVTLTPPFANALLLDVTAITAGANITAGTIYAEAKRPTGRTYPPT
jgi:hypothetical protein